MITTKTLAIPAIALGCLVAHGAGIQAEHLDAEFDDGREGVELGRRMADWAGTISTTADLSNKQQRNDTPVASGAVSDNWDRADIKTVRLTPEVFPSLSADVVADLTRRRCVIPQPWLATEPANVVHGRFTVPGRTDAAVLCSKERVSSILVYRGNSTDHVDELAPVADRGYLQDVGRGRIGFSREIGVADAERVRHGVPPTAARSHETDVDGIEDFFLEKASSIWYWHDGKWLQLAGSD